MGKSKKKTDGDMKKNGDRVSKWKQVFNRENSFYDENTIEDLDDIIYWMRQVLSTIIGVLFGIIPVTGFMGILCYGATICAFLHFYMKKFVTLDDNELFGPSNYLVKCGLMPGFGMFMVSWVATFSIVSSAS